MVPIVIRAWMQGDLKVLQAATEGPAWAKMSSSVKVRQSEKAYWDPRILDIHRIDVDRAVVLNDTAYVLVTFQCQHVDCTYDLATKQVKTGSKNRLKTVHYQWVIRRDLESEDFDWIISEFVDYQLHLLA